MEFDELDIGSIENNITADSRYLHLFIKALRSTFSQIHIVVYTVKCQQRTDITCPSNLTVAL